MNDHGLFIDCEIRKIPAGTLQVVDFELEEHLSKLFTLNVTLVSDLPQLDVQDKLLVERAILRVYSNGILQRQVEGMITEAEIGTTGFHKTIYKITVRPWLWLLTLSQTSQLFHRCSVPKILEKLFSKHYIRFENRLKKPHSVREYTTQKRETDYEFFSRLAAEEGIIFWFKSDKEKGESLVLSDSYSGGSSGLNLVYNPHPQSSNEGDFISKLDFSYAVTPVKFIGKDRSDRNPSYPYLHEYEENPLKISAEKYTIYDSYARFPSDDMGKQIAETRLSAIQQNSAIGTAKSNCFSVMPGRNFRLSEHPNDPFNDLWQPIKVIHKGTMPQALNEDADDSAATLTNDITFISARTEWKAPFVPKPLADGPEIADVAGPAGEEIYINKLGQVLVRFHWDRRHDRPSGNSSCWLRVAQGWSGNGYGFYAIPRIGQEVIVSYLNGDIDRPIITGCTYNGAMRPPLNLPEEKTRTVFKTKTHKGKGANELYFDDKHSKEGIYIHAEKDLNVRVQHDETSRVENDRKHHIVHNDFLKIEGEKRDEITEQYSLSVGKSAHLKTEESLLVNSGDDVHLKAGKRLVLDAGSEIVLKVGGHFVQIDSSGIKVSPSLAVNGSTPDLGRLCQPRLPEKIQDTSSELFSLVSMLTDNKSFSS